MSASRLVKSTRMLTGGGKTVAPLYKASQRCCEYMTVKRTSSFGHLQGFIVRMHFQVANGPIASSVLLESSLIYNPI